MKKRLILSGFLWLSAARAATEVPVLVIKDSINVAVTEYIKRGLEHAELVKAPAVLIELDTPGGFLESTRDIVQMFLNSERPIIVWVTPQGARAASAGAMITMAAHYAAMAPSTSIGAATPIDGAGHEMAKDLASKVKNDTVSFVVGIAQKRGRNVEWAKKSVTEAASLEAAKALQENVIDAIHATQAELWVGAAKKLQLSNAQNATLVPFAISVRENFLSFVSNPNIAYALLSLGVLGIYLEMTHPGTVVPGAIGALSLALGAITMKIIPIRPGALALMVLGLLLLAIEVLTSIPTFGVAGFCGLVSLFLSGLFLLDPGETNLRLSAGLWIPLFLAASALMILIGWAAMKALASKPYKIGTDALVGKEAVINRIDPNGDLWVLVNGELWRARWQGTLAPAQNGQRVKITKQEGLLVHVAPSQS